MYDIAKKARSGMKAKAERLAGEKDRKTDSSDWSPPEPLNADVKTGMRPVSRRAYKKGGAVKGEVGKQRADRAPRKAGGKVDTKGEQPLVDRYINRDLKKANDYRDGTKHIGGMKKGGRIHKDDGGSAGRLPSEAAQYAKERAKYDDAKGEYITQFGRQMNPMRVLEGGKSVLEDYKNFTKSAAGLAKSMRDVKKSSEQTGYDYKRGGRAKKANGGGSMSMEEMIKKNPAPKKDNGFKMPNPVPVPPRRQPEPIPPKDYEKADPRLIKAAKGGKVKDKACYGGRMKKADGGPTQMDPRLGIVNPKMLQFGANEVTPGLKKGGRVKKEVGGPARAAGAASMPSLAPVNVTSAAPNIPSVGSGLLPPSTASYTKAPTYDPDKYGAPSAAESLLDKIKGNKGKRGQTVTEVRPAKAYGGALAMGGKAKSKSAKGKTNINIIIATGKPSKTEETPMAPMGAGAPPMVPPAAMMGAPAPAPMGGPAMPPMGPPPAPAGAGKPPMPMPPMPRKAGGRVSKVARSYKDMTAGAGSGEGRLQKTDIAKRAPHKAGGKVYRSYKDMDAGAGSGEGRLEKTEIQSRKK